MITYNSIAAMKMNRYILDYTSQLNKVNTQLSTGHVINKAADDPASFCFISSLQSNTSQYSVFCDNIQNGVTITDTATSALTSMNSNLTEIQKLLTTASSGTCTDAQRRVIQEQINGLIDTMYNTQYNAGFTDDERYSGIQVLGQDASIQGVEVPEVEEYDHLTKDDFTNITTTTINGVSFTKGVSKEDGKTYYFVENATQLQKINYSSATKGYNYVLMGDIDLQNTTWTAIGTSSYQYTGTFDGNGYNITNLSINKSTVTWEGLFAYSSGTIKNVTMENANITGYYVGALVGQNSGTVTNCEVKNSTVTGKGDVGGLIGKSNGGSISDCSATNLTITGISSSGGLIGSTSNGSTITNCNVKNSTVSGSSYFIGGLIGGLYDGQISDSYTSNVEVTGNGTGDNVGGLVGQLSKSSDSYSTSISNCYASGTVSGDIDVGGLVGQISKSSSVTENMSISNCYATGTVSGNIRIGGFIGESEYVNISNSYTKDIEVNATSGYGGFLGQKGTSTTITNSYTTVTDSYATVESDDWFATQEAVDTLGSSNWELKEDIDHPTLISNPEVTTEIETKDIPTYLGTLQEVTGPMRIQTGKDSVVTIDTALNFDEIRTVNALTAEDAAASLAIVSDVQNTLNAKSSELGNSKIQLTSQLTSATNHLTYHSDLLSKLNDIDVDEKTAEKEELEEKLTNAEILKTTLENLNTQTCKTLILGTVYGQYSAATSSWINSILTNSLYNSGE